MMIERNKFSTAIAAGGAFSALYLAGRSGDKSERLSALRQAGYQRKADPSKKNANQKERRQGRRQGFHATYILAGSELASVVK